MRPALRYRCIGMARSGFCTQGAGVPSRKRCAYCGGKLLREQGVYGVFSWTGNGRYPIENATRTFASEKRAQALCDSEAGRTAGWVVRWTPTAS